MKVLFLIFLTVTFINCSNIEEDKLIIKKFLNTVKVTEKFEDLNTGEFFKKIDLKSRNSGKILEVLNYEINNLNLYLNKNDNIRVLSHEEFSILQLDFNFSYSDFAKVFYILGEKNKVITTIILEEKKIISFTHNIRKEPNQLITPLILSNI